METSIGVMEENPPAKSSGTLIQINSISIELPGNLIVMNACDTCQHHFFTILGLAVEKRRTNPNASMPFPFPSNDNPNNAVAKPPPMHVPSSRFWNCQECRKSFDIACSTEAMILSETQQVPITVNTENIQAVDRNVSSNTNTNPGSSLISSPQKNKNARTGDVDSTGDKNESSEQVTDTVAEIRDEIEDVIARGDDTISAEKMNTDAADVSFPSQTQNSADGSEHGSPQGKNLSAVVEYGADRVPGKMDDSGIEHFRDNENSLGLPRRKIRKVRLLTDLLGENGNSRGDRVENNPSCNSLLLESAGSGNAVTEGQVGLCKDIAKGVGSPPRKTKVPQEEEETNGASNVATKIRAPRKDTGKAIMTIDDPDSEEEINASAGEGLFIGSKAERSRRRSDNTPALGRKKNKQSQVLDFESALPSLIRSIQAPSAAESWRSYQSPEQRDWHHVHLTSGALKLQQLHNRPAESGLDLSLDSLVKKIDSINQSSASKDPVKKDCMLFGESITRPATVSDRSRSKRPLWDLNERASQNSHNLEKGSFSSPKELDFLQLGLKEKSLEIQGKPKEIEQRADDIPMEIVELLAKQQYERRNGDIGDSSVPNRTINSTRRFLEVEEIRTMKQFAKEFPNFPPVNPRRWINRTSNGLGTVKGNTSNLSHFARNHLKMVQAGENQTKSIYTAFPQNQQKLYSGVQISAAASVRPGLRCSETVEPLLLSTSTKVPFGLGIQQKHPAEQHKGKTISDIKADELRKTEEARLIFPKPGGFVVNSKAKGLLDPYAKESIPAMQLLSLMDGRSPGTSFNLGPSKILNKPFAPCSYHPRFGTNERRDFLNGSSFSPVCHPKEPSGLGAYQSFRQSLDVLSGQISFRIQEQEKSRDKLQKPGSTGAGPSSSHGKDKQKPTLDALSTMPSPQQHQRLANSSSFNLEANNIYGDFRSMSSEGVCSVSRNPADFSIPEAGNAYTISGRDLKFRKRRPRRQGPPSVKVDDAKRQRRVTKVKTGNEDAQHKSS